MGHRFHQKADHEDYLDDGAEGNIAMHEQIGGTERVYMQMSSYLEIPTLTSLLSDEEAARQSGGVEGPSGA